MSIGSIIVDLLARTGSFDTDIDRSTKAADKKMRQLKKTVDDAGKAMGVSLAAGGAAAVYFTKQWVDGLDALNDAADATGASIENLSAIEDIAIRTGTSMDSATGAIVKFNMGLKGTDDDGKAAKSLEAIGLNIQKLRDMDPAEALLETAKALAKFRDDGDKARLVQELFGKSVREMAPLLKDLAEKGELVATVTTEQAKEAETFNKELFSMQKNVTDLGRSFAGDLVKGINEAAKAMREGGLLEGLKVLFGGNEAYRADKRLVDLTNDLLLAENSLARAREANGKWWIVGTEKAMADAEARVKRIKAEIAPIMAARQANPMSFDALRRSEATGYLPGVGAVDTGKGKKGPAGANPNADYDAALKSLQGMLRTTEKLTEEQEVLAKVKDGSLTLDTRQLETLTAIARQVDVIRDKREEAEERRKAGRDAVMAEADAFKADSERLQAALGETSSGKLAAQRREMEFFVRMLDEGAISQAEYLEIVTDKLDLVADKTGETNDIAQQLGMTFSSAFEAAVIEGRGLREVFSGLLMDIAKLILRLEVTEPLMARLREAMGGKAGGGGGGLLAMILGAARGGFTDTGAGISPPNPFFASAAAGGGDVLPNRSYLVGEHGREVFTPRTAGAIAPTGSGGGWTIVNKTTGRVDRVREEISPQSKQLIIEETLNRFDARLANQSSPTSKILKRNFDVRPQR